VTLRHVLSSQKTSDTSLNSLTQTGGIQRGIGEKGKSTLFRCTFIELIQTRALHTHRMMAAKRKPDPPHSPHQNDDEGWELFSLGSESELDDYRAGSNDDKGNNGWWVINRGAHTSTNTAQSPTAVSANKIKARGLTEREFELVGSLSGLIGGARYFFRAVASTAQHVIIEARDKSDWSS
jgi:hypothetical protein